MVELFDEVGAGDEKRPLPRHIQFHLQQVARHGDIMMDRVGGLECEGKRPFFNTNGDVFAQANA